MAIVDRGNTLFDLSAAVSPAVCLYPVPAAPPRHRAPQPAPTRDRVATAGGMVGSGL